MHIRHVIFNVMTGVPYIRGPWVSSSSYWIIHCAHAWIHINSHQALPELALRQRSDVMTGNVILVAYRGADVTAPARRRSLMPRQSSVRDCCRNQIKVHVSFDCLDAFSDTVITLIQAPSNELIKPVH